MRLADTNVLLGFVMPSGERQTVALDTLVSGVESADERLVVTEVVLAEAVWVLRSFYGWERGAIASALIELLSTPSLVAWDPAVAGAALGLMASDPRLDIADCLLAARARVDGDEVVTFDERLRRTLEG
ncbi:MAG: hypothetical protein C0418_02265 [Coriobacteriaceae bacterium]|nr:hypothetical protein [Coriobacteriaceae bacterium]